MAKSADAFRTISEVAEILQVPAHVLRFWESKFTQIKPVKRAGGRRYYRPDDIRLLSGIRTLLHDDGMTIKGVQKILRERGTAHVAEMAPTLSDMPDAAGSETTEAKVGAEVGAEVLSFDRRSGTATGAGAEPSLSETTPDDADPQQAPDASPPAPPPDAPEHATVSEPEPDATPAPLDAAAPERGASAPAAPSLPPLPDLPDDPGDTLPAPPGALAALAGLRGPVPADLATRLSAIAARLHGFDAQRPANAVPNTAPNTATGD